MRSYTILGTGALGGYYGARLHHAGRRVRFVLHTDVDQVRRHGLRVESPDGDFSITAPEAYGSEEAVPPSDVVVVALKATQNALLDTRLPELCGEEAAILVMQNGLGVEPRIARRMPGRPILGGLSFLCSNKVGPGHIVHLDYGAIRLGQHTDDGSAAGITPLMESVAADFRDAGIRVDLEDDLLDARWKKLVWNVPFNGLCVLHRMTTDVLMADPARRAEARELMLEVQEAAAACGHPIPSSFVEKMLDDTAKMKPYKPSMLLDLERGQPLEIEAIYAAPLAAAREAGVECPRIQALYESLRSL